MSELGAPVTLESACGELSAYAHGGQVVSWRPYGEGHEVLWLSPQFVLDSRVAIRGGVPVCFPWFGPGRTGDQSPAHGFARLSRWQIDDMTATDEELWLRMSLESVTNDNFPYSYRLAIDVRASSELVLTLRVINLDQVPFTIEEALHAYLQVGDVRTVIIRGLDGAPYADKTRDGRMDEQSGDLVLTSETDRAYASTCPIDIVDPVLGRTLHVHKEGSASTIIWNPWETKAAAMADIGNESWTSFVCVEAGNVLDQAVTIQPGEAHLLTYRLSVLR